jgi:hypothetical protein
LLISRHRPDRIGNREREHSSSVAPPATSARFGFKPLAAESLTAAEAAIDALWETDAVAA